MTDHGAWPGPPPGPLLLSRLRAVGMIHPVWTFQAARESGLSLPLGCSLLVQESAGGQNVFGHDPTIFVGAGTVTEAKYHLYLAERGPTGRGGMQGVGPGQLTWWSLQDAADRLGGCWRPDCNIRVAFAHLAELVRRGGVQAGVAAYNGSGPQAGLYAAGVIGRAIRFAGTLNVPLP